MILSKNESHFLYSYFVFTSLLFIIYEVLIKTFQISGEEKIWTDMFDYLFQESSSWHDVNRTLRRPINYFIYPWRHLRVTSWELV